VGRRNYSFRYHFKPEQQLGADAFWHQLWRYTLLDNLLKLAKLLNLICVNELMRYDYIIVGGGSAGSTLAARLTEDPVITVCLLEAGGEGKGIVARAPAAAIASAPGRPPINNWCLETVPQAELNNRKGYQPRGKCLGGSSTINAMLYVRGHPTDYDEWAAQGCTGWSYDEVLPYFKKSENNENGSDQFHGDSGPLHVSNQQSPRPITHAFVEAGESLGIPRNDDINGAKHEGIGLYQVTQFHGKKNGERCSTAAAYLHPAMDRPNLTVITKAHATSIILEAGRAVGVRYRKTKKDEQVFCNNEVLLCGGAFHSPQLLMLSGIGPKDELAKHNIDLVHDLPGVGQNLQDHLDFTLLYKSHTKDLIGLGFSAAVSMIKHILQWRKDGTGLVATPFAEGMAFLKTDESLARPDIQLHFVVAIVDDHARKLHMGYGYSCHACVLRPESRGEVGLNSADPFDAPRIDPRFLSAQADQELLLKGTKVMREIMEAPALKSHQKSELYTANAHTDEELMQHIRSRADTIYHPVGTCKMGSDELATVDPKLRVRGIAGLRVVDASVMPTLIGGNTNAPTIMIAEKAADLIKQARLA